MLSSSSHNLARVQPAQSAEAGIAAKPLDQHHTPITTVNLTTTATTNNTQLNPQHGPLGVRKKAWKEVRNEAEVKR